MNEFHGFLVLDKPCGLTSRAVVDRASRWFPRRTRLGHAGTLDPLATGVLVLGVGNGTRLIEYVQRMEKEYLARIRLGATSDTDDADGTITVHRDAILPDENEIDAALSGFIGEFDQVPPDFSAAHVEGRRAYDLARRGREVRLMPRRVRIHGIDRGGYTPPHLEIVVRCGKGTYIRSLARDLGRVLGCGGMIETLRRTRIGGFRAESSLSLDISREIARAGLLPLEAALSELPRVELPRETARAFVLGTAVPLPTSIVANGECVVHLEEGGMLGVGVADAVRLQVRPEKVLGRVG